MALKNEYRVDHIAIAVSSLDEVLPFYEETLGLEVLSVETVESEGVRVAKLCVGNTHIELLEPLDSNSPVAKFLEKRGPGLHHLCLGVTDIDRKVDMLVKDGVKMINETPKGGADGARIAFIHPRSSGGTLLELSQPTSDPAIF